MKSARSICSRTLVGHGAFQGDPFSSCERLQFRSIPAPAGTVSLQSATDETRRRTGGPLTCPC